MNLEELKKARAAALASANSIVAKAKADKDRDLTDDEADEVERLTAEATAHGEAIAKIEKRTQARAALDAANAASARPAGRKFVEPDSALPVAHEPAVARENVLSDPKLGFANLGDFALALHDAGPSRGGIEASPRLRAVLAAAGTGMTQGVTADGGVLVPPAFEKQIWDGARQKSESLLGYCDVHPIDPGVQSVTIPAIAETDRATGSRWGGVRGYWKSELTQMQESKPKLRDVKLEPQELYVLGYISDKLLRSAPGTASNLLAMAAADEINFLVGNAVMNGTGAGQPVGVVGHASVVSVAKETNQVAGTIVKQNIDKMWARCHANWRAGAVWFINQAVEPELENLSQVVGTGGVPVYLPAGGVADTPNARLKGRPVVPLEYCAALGTVGDIVLANLGAYAIGLRGLVDQSQSMHLKFDFAQTAYRFIFEVDGQPWLASPITPFKDTTKTLSPIVTLATR